MQSFKLYSLRPAQRLKSRTDSSFLISTTPHLWHFQHEVVVAVPLYRHVVAKGGGVVALRLVQDLILLGDAANHELLAVVRGHARPADMHKRDRKSCVPGAMVLKRKH